MDELTGATIDGGNRKERVTPDFPLTSLPSQLGTDLLTVRVAERQPEVILLQKVEVLTHHVEESLSSAVFLTERDRDKLTGI